MRDLVEDVKKRSVPLMDESITTKRLKGLECHSPRYENQFRCWERICGFEVIELLLPLMVQRP